jgi:hypothetical protein
MLRLSRSRGRCGGCGVRCLIGNFTFDPLQHLRRLMSGFERGVSIIGCGCYAEPPPFGTVTAMGASCHFCERSHNSRGTGIRFSARDIVAREGWR